MLYNFLLLQSLGNTQDFGDLSSNQDADKTVLDLSQEVYLVVVEIFLKEYIQ